MHESVVTMQCTAALGMPWGKNIVQSCKNIDKVGLYVYYITYLCIIDLFIIEM